MGQFYESIPDGIIAWIRQQHLFWVATAPLSARGHVNVSPKGGAFFGVLDAHTFWYLDLTGSGCETLAHLRENGRITINFNAFEGKPQIVRLWGRGRILERSTAAFDAFVGEHEIEVIPGARSIILVDIHQVGSSCGFSVPYMDFKGHRDILTKYYEKKQKSFDEGKESERLDRYWAWKNAWSMDGIPGMQAALATADRENIKPLRKMIGAMAPAAPYGSKSYSYRRAFERRITILKATRVELVHTLVAVVFALLVGVLIGLYGPAFHASQRAHIQRLLG